MITATRYHDFSAGHRVVGHENKCRHLHGHNYRVHFTVEADQLDELGRVMDFGAIKDKLCQWLEDAWDHKFIIAHDDPLLVDLQDIVGEDLAVVPFNPTAENMAKFLLWTWGPMLLKGTNVTLVEVTVEETVKCSATATR